MIKWKTDLSEVAAFTGSTQGYTDYLQTPIYLDDVLRISHAKVMDDFNDAAVVYAASTKAIAHAFEWGAGGINSAPGTPTIDPLNPLARLWVHTFVGHAGRRKVDFEFRASRVAVPLPNPDASGLDEDFLAERGPQRRHFFFWKAPIMEYGIPVEIKPKYAKALFIPLSGAESLDPRANERGYIMTTRAVKMVPGQQFAGRFTAFWQLWWTTEGYKRMSLLAQEVSNMDSSDIVATNSIEARRYVHGVVNKPFTLQASTARAKARMEMANKSRARRRVASGAERKEAAASGGEVFKKGRRR